MDAKPQRPLRFRPLRDENQVSFTLPGKSIHQKNKSSPALSSLATDAALKLGPKRTAFADVSNTSRASNHATKDDSALFRKPVLENPIKNMCLEEHKSAAAPLLRPAQRPMSTSGVKALLSTIVPTAHHHSNALPPKHLLSQEQEPYDFPTAQHRTAAARKKTSIYQDTRQHPSIECGERISSCAQDVLESALADALDQPPLQPVGHYASFVDKSVKGPSSVQQTSEIKQDAPLFQSEPEADNDISSDYVDIRSDQLPLNDAKDVPWSIQVLPELLDEIQPYDEEWLRHLSRPLPALPEENIQDQRQRPCGPLATSATAAATATAGAAGVTVVDRWEEETYGESDEADYTTGRSIRSKGDLTTNTTTTTTIIMAPKLTLEAERELAEARKFVIESQEVSELEEDEAWDTSMVAEYGEEIFAYMRALEEQMRPNPCYMDSQTEVEWPMRSILMDWLVQVHTRFGLLPETLFLCVNYIDRFLSCKVVSLNKLQLVGATAIFVAAKYEEINCPSVQEIVYMVDGGYTVDEILKAERFMLSMLQFELGWPGPMSFLRRISKADDYDLETRTLAKYFLEITIMDERFVGCIPSYTAAGAHCLARLMLQKGEWSRKHVHYSGYTYAQLHPLVTTLLYCCDDGARHHAAIFDKYDDKRFKRASSFVQAELDKGFMLPSVHRQSSIDAVPAAHSHLPRWKSFYF